MMPYDKLLKFAQKKLEARFEHIDFSSNPRTLENIAVLLAADALLKAGSTISIRWLSPEEQERHIGDCEEMMIDQALEDSKLVAFYRSMIEAKFGQAKTLHRQAAVA